MAEVKALLLTDSLGASAGAFSKGFRTIIGEGKVIGNFTKAEQSELGKEVVDFISLLPKGDKLKPLDRDTVYFSTYVRPGYLAADGTVVAPERLLEISIPNGVGSGFSMTCSKTPLILEDGTRCQEPMTAAGIMNAINKIRTARNLDRWNM